MARRCPPRTGFHCAWWRPEPLCPQDPIEGRFRCDVLTSVGEARNDLLRRQVAKFGRIRHLDDDLSLRFGELLMWRRARASALIVAAVALLAPTLHRPWVQVDFVACRGQTAAGGHRLLEQREGREADFVHVSSPSSPQRAPAFFLRTRRAAVSARAASLRFSSRSRSLIRFCSSLRGFFDMVSPATAA